MGKVDIYAMNIGAWLTSPVDTLLEYFEPERRERILRYRFVEDQNRTVWAELLARSLIGAHVGQPALAVRISRDKSGKPYRPEDDVNFSLAHSDSWVVCSIGKEKNGTDVQIPRENFLGIAERFFLPEEARFLHSMPPDARASAFLRYWTLKESYLKLTGEGLSGGLDTVDAEGLLAGRGEIAGRCFRLKDGAVAGICAPPDALPEHLVIVKAHRRDTLIITDEKIPPLVTPHTSSESAAHSS